MFSAAKKKQALELYDQFKSITKVILLQVYPSRQSLYLSISQRNDPPKHKSALRGKNIPEHPGHLPSNLNWHHCIVASNLGKMYNQKKSDTVEPVFILGAESIFKRGRLRL